MGEDYPIRSDADIGYLHDLARYVEDKISGVSSKNKLPPRLKREILAAILIADDYFSEKRKNAELMRKQAALKETVDKALTEEMT